MNTRRKQISFKTTPRIVFGFFPPHDEIVIHSSSNSRFINRYQFFRCQCCVNTRRTNSVRVNLPSLFGRLSSDALFGAKEGFGISAKIKRKTKLINKQKTKCIKHYGVTGMNFHVSPRTKSPGYVIYCTIDPNLYK